MSMSRLTRSDGDRVIAGVCGGIANYLEVDPVFVRLAFLVLLFASGIGLIIYFTLWVVMPRDESIVIGDGSTQDKGTDVTNKVSTGVSRLSRPGTVGVILLVLGGYLFLGRLGLLGWLDGAIFWPLMIIGVGIYLLLKRRQA